MNSLKDLLLKKATSIEKDGIKSDLDIVQSELNRYFEGNISITTFKAGVATVVTSNSSLASTMRMQQHQLIEDLNSSLKNKISRFIIRIA